VRHFKMLIVSAVKICKQHLHTASASRGLQPQMKIPVAAIVCRLQGLHFVTLGLNIIACSEFDAVVCHGRVV